MLLHAAVLLSLTGALSDTTRRTETSGAITVTNKGISLIPSFTLGKPATIVDVAVTRGELAFEPQFKVGLDGYPWAFLFWGRYRPNIGDRFRLVVGAHPAVQFHRTPVTIGGTPHTVTTTNRYFVTELGPSVVFAKNVRAGLYWLDGHGLDRDGAQHAHFVSLRSTVNVPLGSTSFVQLLPQTYYLWQDRREAEYANGAMTLGDRRLPISLSAMVNRKLHGTLPTQDVLWNVSLMYSIR